MKPIRAARIADREVDAIVPQLRRAKRLRLSASAVDLARAEPIPSWLEEMAPEKRKDVGLELFEQTGLSKRAYWRESGHESWTHARSLVTPGTERIPTPWDLWVLTKVVLLLTFVPAPQSAPLRNAS